MVFVRIVVVSKPWIRSHWSLASCHQKFLISLLDMHARKWTSREEEEEEGMWLTYFCETFSDWWNELYVEEIKIVYCVSCRFGKMVVAQEVFIVTKGVNEH